MRVLTIGNSDSGGCTGIQADLKTFSALGCFGTSAITSVTAQNTRGIMDIYHVSAITLRNQIAAVIEDIGIDAVKIGMLHTCEAIVAVADIISEYMMNNLVFDPFISAFSGDTLLLKGGAVNIFRELILPQTTVFTPGIAEASLFLECDLEPGMDFRDRVRQLAGMGCKSILLKGIPQEDELLTDLFYHVRDNRFFELCYRRQKRGGAVIRGKCCTLSAAIVAFLARGYSLDKAVFQARNYLNAAITGGRDYQVGDGCCPIHHFYDLWD